MKAISGIGGYEIKISDDGVLELHQTTPAVVTKMTVSELGVKQEALPQTDSLVRYLSTTPLLVANFAGNGQYNVDCNAGLQRWHGTKSGKDMAGALRRFGFDNAGDILKQVRKFKHDGVRYCY